MSMKSLLKKHLSLHLTLAFIISLFACLGLALVYLADRTYQQQGIQQQQTAMRDLLAIKSGDLIDELIHHQKELGFVLQSEQTFTKSFINRDIKALRYWLDQEFNRYYTTTGLIKLEKLLVYDTDFKLIARSARGVAMGERGTPPCARLIRNMNQLPVTEHLKPRSELCLFNNRPLLSTVVSIGSLQPRGYIQIVSDPAYNLAAIQDMLDVELRITTHDNTILHQSSGWPRLPGAASSYLNSSHTIPSSDGNPLLIVSSASHVNNLNDSLAKTSNQLIATSMVAIAVTLVLALSLLYRALRPLSTLQLAANEIIKGKQVSTVDSFREIATPIRLFNKAAARIDALASDLEYEIETHNTTEEKLRQAIKRAEDNALKVKTQRNQLRMTLQSVIDGVITTDMQGNITYINPIAVQLTGWSEADACGKTLIQVFHALDADTRERIYDPLSNSNQTPALEEALSAILIQHDSQVETPVEYIATPMLDSDDQLTGNVIIIHDKSLQRSLNRQLTFQATHDALTGLFNRFEFEKRLKQVVADLASSAAEHCLCYLDIDAFKKINDDYGHTAGDELLKQVSGLIEKTLGDDQILARLGGDEFGLLLINSDTETASALCGKILQTFDRFNFIWDMSSTSISISIGITPIQSDEISYLELLSNARSACRLAKEDGRDRLQLYTAENSQLLTQQREMHWVSRINHALEEQRIQLYFHEIQPLQQDSKRFMRQGEALLRMIDKQGNLVSPNMFLPAAERYGMMNVIDEWVVDRTIDWLRTENSKAMVSINISGKSIASTSFLNHVVSRLKQTRINPELLCFEMTEAVAIRHLSAAVHFMTVLKKLGCSFALDDFGSGLSSFSYLTSLPVDYLKIDGSFVVDIDKDPMHYAMVKSINDVGHVMGIKTIAEFAASSQIIECLREIGVDYAQGYAVARPVPLSSVREDGEDDTEFNVVQPGN